MPDLRVVEREGEPTISPRHEETTPPDREDLEDVAAE
jgi:hypothetical protein